MKSCTRCGALKALHEYHKKHGNPIVVCKLCVVTYKAKYYIANKERIIKYRVANKQLIAVRGATWRAANKEHVMARTAAYHALPETKLKFKQLMRIRKSKYQIAVDFGAPTDEFIYQHYGMVCYVSGVRLTAATRSIDHIIPLSKGGDWSLKNRRPMHKSLNSSKCDRDFDEWLAKPATKALIRSIRSEYWRELVA